MSRNRSYAGGFKCWKVAVQLYLKVSWCVATAIVQGRSVFVGVENNILMQIKLCTLGNIHNYIGT